jgi:putative addiction module component (TIGR02574 family)
VDAAQIEAILKLDVDERIRIVQIIWDSIADSPDAVPLTDAEKANIEKLVAEDDADPGDVMSWPEAKALIRAR